MQAQDVDHLLPETSFYADSFLIDYELLVAGLLGDEALDISPKVVVLPSFRLEYAVGIESNGVGCNIVHAEVRFNVWLYFSGALNFDDLDDETKREFESYPKSPTDIPIDITRQMITSQLCSSITNAWNEVLLATRYPEPSGLEVIILDGTYYHFSSSVDGVGVVTGQTHSPRHDSLPGLLVQLSESMRIFAQNGGQSDLNNLEQAVARLIQGIE